MELHIYEQLTQFNKKSPIRLHMPAHKGRTILEGISTPLDITELDGTDIVRSVEKAQEDICKILGVKFAKIKSDGASMCIFSALHTAKEFGNKIIINRNAHKCVYNALKVLGIEPIIIEEVSQIYGLDLQDERVIGAMLTYPDYYGKIFDLKGVASTLKRAGKLLFIDNSHGGHFAYFNKDIYAGNFADVWVDSAHKVLPTLNQGAMLLSNNERLIESLESSSEIFCTTSPSYPILASVEFGVKYMAGNSQGLVESITKINGVKANLIKEGLVLMQNDDSFKIVVDCNNSGMDNGLVQQGLLKEEIYFELNDGNNILFMLSVNNDQNDLERLEKCLIALKKNKQTASVENKPASTFSGLKSARKIDYLRAVNSQTQLVELKKSIGKICAENVGVFPPCYPVVTAGEEIAEEAVEILKNNPNIFGVYQGKIKIVKE